ncbi:MAG: hypothetical protein AB8G22_16050 [Saprospiraceae bacterium]
MRIFSLLLFVSFLTFFSCSNEFELNAPYQDVAVVYGFIDKDDPVHYIRVEKAFIDQETSAVELAKNPDSLYYENVLVEVVRLDKGNETIVLERVNGDDVGLPREEGDFAQSPNILYGFSLADDEKLEGEERLQLRVSRGDEKEVVTAETTIIGDIEFQQGRPPETDLSFQYTRNTSFAWFARQGGQLFDLVLDVNIQELDPEDNSQFIDRTFEWVIRRNIRRESDGGPQVKVDIPGELFYQFLQSQLENEPRRQRFFKSIDVNVSAAGQELVDFLDITQANTGITSAQEVPTFTNLEGGAVGLFTSRKTAIVQVTSLARETRDSLRSGIYTKNLNFQ